MKFVLAMLVVVGMVMVGHSDPSDKLIDALIEVESGGDVNAIGDNGNAVGCLQIWKIVVDDVNRFSKTKKYTYEDRKRIIESKEICRKYLLHYGGKNATNEKYARIWNGGPKGYKKTSTIKYWKKVQAKVK